MEYSHFLLKYFEKIVLMPSDTIQMTTFSVPQCHMN